MLCAFDEILLGFCIGWQLCSFAAFTLLSPPWLACSSCHSRTIPMPPKAKKRRDAVHKLGCWLVVEPCLDHIRRPGKRQCSKGLTESKTRSRLHQRSIPNEVCKFLHMFCFIRGKLSKPECVPHLVPLNHGDQLQGPCISQAEPSSSSARSSSGRSDVQIWRTRP